MIAAVRSILRLLLRGTWSETSIMQSTAFPCMVANGEDSVLVVKKARHKVDNIGSAIDDEGIE